MLDAASLRSQFPIFAAHPSLVYLDSAATAQRPSSVLERMSEYYRTANANAHRGVYRLSQEASAAYDDARSRVQTFINAAHREEIVFLRGTTEAANLVAHSFLRPRLREGDEILLTTMEHHSNIVPWQLVASEKGATLKVVPVDELGDLRMDLFPKLLSKKTKLVCISHVSNVLGTINPIQDIVRLAHAAGAPVFVDGAQAVAHFSVDVRELGCDFYAFSSHKVYGPTGIGVLYGKRDLLQNMPPYQGGGDMIRSVSFAGTVFQDAPGRFEAGTPNVAGAVGLGAALDFITQLKWEALVVHDAALSAAAREILTSVPGVRVIGKPSRAIGVLSFVCEAAHPHDIGTVLDSVNVAVRTGHHCAQPLMEHLGLEATARVSFGVYNTVEELARLNEGLHKVRKLFG